MSAPAAASPPDAPTDRRTFVAAWVATFLINVAWGSVLPLLNVYIRDRGISLVLIGTLSTVSAVAYSVAGVAIGRLSDRVGNRREMVTVMLVLAAGGWLALLWARDFWHFLVLGVLDLGLIGGYSILIDAIVTAALPAEGRGGGFGRYRISGSIGFALAGALLGVVTSAFGTEAIFIIACGAHLAAAVAIRFTREPPPTPRQTEAGAPVRRRGVWQTLVVTGLVWLMAADLLAVFGSQIAFPFMNIYIADRFAASAGVLGLLSTVGVLAEIPAMIWLGGLSDRVGRGAVLALGFISMGLCWLLMFLAPGLWLIYLARPLMGLSIVRYSVGVALITDRVPYEDRATLLGLSNLTYGAGGLVAPGIGGLIAQTMGIRPVFLAAFVVQMLATLLFVGTLRRGERPVETAGAN